MVIDRSIVLSGILAACASLLWACGGGPSSGLASTTPPTPTVNAIAVSGTAPAGGETAQFTATATLSNGTTQNVTAQAAWTSSNEAVATVSPEGVVTAVAAGDADVKAIYQGVSGSAHISIASRAPAATVCTFSLSTTTVSEPPNGGSESIGVTTSDELCAWTATTNSPFITLTAGANGTGNGTVSFTVAPNPGTARSGTLTIAGQTLTLNQDAVPPPATPACTTTTLSPISQGFGEAATTASVRVAASNCSWTAVSNAGFITIVAGSSGTGNGSVTFSITANTTGRSRTGTITIGGSTFTVSQDACGYTLSATTFAIDPAGGTGSVTVTAITACAWTATSNAPPSFITIASGSSGSGTGTVTFTVSANTTGVTRSGTLTIAGQTVTVSQAAPVGTPGCTYAVSPTTVDMTANGGGFGVSITPSASNCTWTVMTNAAFITIAGGQAGIGPGTVFFNVAGNTGTARSGTVTIAGQTVTVAQAGQSATPCVTSISPTSQTVPSDKTTGTIAVTAPSNCSWTAVVNDLPDGSRFVSVPAGSGGTGNGTVSYTVSDYYAAVGPPRIETITIGGRTFSVTQQLCAFEPAPSAEVVFGAGGGTTTIPILGKDGGPIDKCRWYVSSVDWRESGIKTPQPPFMVAPVTGQGTGSFTVTVPAYSGTDRWLMLQYTDEPVGGPAPHARVHSVKITQSGPLPPVDCTYGVNPSTFNVAASGASALTFSVGTNLGICPWTVTSSASFLTVTSGRSGTGNGTVTFSVAANTGATRTGTFTVAGLTVTVTQQMSP